MDTHTTPTTAPPAWARGGVAASLLRLHDVLVVDAAAGEGRFAADGQALTHC